VPVSVDVGRRGLSRRQSDANVITAWVVESALAIVSSRGARCARSGGSRLAGRAGAGYRRRSAREGVCLRAPLGHVSARELVSQLMGAAIAEPGAVRGAHGEAPAGVPARVRGG
jgi:hypothetical protein